MISEMILFKDARAYLWTSYIIKHLLSCRIGLFTAKAHKIESGRNPFKCTFDKMDVKSEHLMIEAGKLMADNHSISSES